MCRWRVRGREGCGCGVGCNGDGGVGGECHGDEMGCVGTWNGGGERVGGGCSELYKNGDCGGG